MKKVCLLAIGWLALILGVVGIFLPLLPTTPFILLASWCFARSSKRFHYWLHTHPKLGPVLSAWESGEGMSAALKLRIIIVMYLGMAISMLLIRRLPASIILIIIACAVTYYLLKLPSKKS